MGEFIYIHKILQLSTVLIVMAICEESICVETTEDIQSIYNAYYEDSEKLRISSEKEDKSDESEELTLMDVFWPFILTFWWIFAIIFFVLITVLCICLLQAVEWSTIGTVLEYLPCHGHSILSARLERLKTPGVYIRKNGIKDYYEPIVDEIEISNDIINRLQ